MEMVYIRPKTLREVTHPKVWMEPIRKREMKLPVIYRRSFRGYYRAVRDFVRILNKADKVISEDFNEDTGAVKAVIERGGRRYLASLTPKNTVVLDPRSEEYVVTILKHEF